jgi:hypothetical protein
MGVHPPCRMETYLEHVWINVSKREIKLLDNEGYDETIRFKFDSEGSEGFAETLANFAQLNPALFTYNYEVAS